MNEIIESAEYTKAVTLHRRICANAQAAQDSLFEVCKGMKEMRDGKLYKELGYSTFEEYSTKEIGFSKKQSYQYIAIAEKFGENVTPGLRNIGVSKLYLLSTLSDEERVEVVEKNDIESISKRELESKIADLKKANERLMGKIDEAEKKAENSRKSEESACGKLSILRTDLEMQQQKIQQLESEKTQLEGENNTIPSLKARLEDQGEALRASCQEVQDLRQQVKELESRPVEVAVEKDTAALEALQKENDERINALQSSHTAELERLKTEYESKLKNISEKEEFIDTKEVFKAYLSNAIDASKRLLEFINANPDEIFKEKARSLFETMHKEVI